MGNFFWGKQYSGEFQSGAVVVLYSSDIFNFFCGKDDYEKESNLNIDDTASFLLCTSCTSSWAMDFNTIVGISYF